MLPTPDCSGSSDAGSRPFFAQRYMDEGQFGVGSMLPKVQAAMDFVASGAGRRAVICSLEKAPLAMRGESGTVIHR
jgi:carbamate kinase